jgi:hypothetical protein
MCRVLYLCISSLSGYLPPPPLGPPMGALSQEGGEGGEGCEESKRDINQVTQSIARCKTGSAYTVLVQYMAVWFTFM